MKRFRNLLLTGITLATLCVAGVSCAPKSQRNAGSVPQDPLTEAYRLMDKGDNAKAAILLEKYLQDHPGNKEAKILLASAYMGEAGVDIYKLYDSFKDVLFNKPLNDRFWGDNTDNSDDDLFGSDADVEQKRDVVAQDSANQDDAPIASVIDQTDKVLFKAKKVIEFLNRFPDVPKEKWPFLDSGLALLDGSGNEKDLCLYRVFFRVIYLKAYLGQELLRNPDVGRREWLCSIDLGQLRENLTWVLSQLSTASGDLSLAFPAKASNINSIQAIVDGMKVSLDDLDHATVGANTGMLLLQSRFRSMLHCGE